jgi:hypothetical protein
VAGRLRPRPAWLLLAIVGGLATVGVWGFSFLAAAFVCSTDTSYCATGETKEYRGRLFDYEGRPAPPTELRFSGSAYDRDADGLRFQTEDGGRFCVIAAEGVTTSHVNVEGQTFASDLVVYSTAPVDPRLADPAVRAELRGDAVQGVDRLPFMVSEPAVTELQEPRGTFDSVGAHDASELWDPALDAARACQELASPRWRRVNDLTGSWQYGVLMLAPAITIVLVLTGLVRKSTRLLQLSCAASATTLLLTYATWTYF